MLSTFEGCHTGPIQYNLRLSCIHERTLNNLKHMKEKLFTLNLVQDPKVSKVSTVLVQDLKGLTFTLRAYQPLSGPVTGPLGTASIV